MRAALEKSADLSEITENEIAMPYAQNRKFTTRERNRLPDSAFLLPKYRKLPFKQVQGGKLRISLPHVRNALARANQVEGVPQGEVRAAVRRARMILDSRGGYKSAPPRPIRLAANASGLSPREAEEFAEYLKSEGIQPLDIEVLPLGSSRRCAVMYWTGYEWDEVFSSQDKDDIMRGSYKSNRASGSYAGEEGLTKREAEKLSRQLSGMWLVHGVRKRGGSYYVEVEGDRGPILVAEEEDLMFAYNGSGLGETALSKKQAMRLASELRSSWNVLGLEYRQGNGWMVKVEGDRGPVLVSDEEDLMFAYNGMRPNFFKKKSPAELAAREEEAKFHAMRSSREWKDFFNGIRSDYAMRGAKPPPLEERQAMADRQFHEYHARLRRQRESGIARNPRRRRY